jgi:hypothetical protein
MPESRWLARGRSHRLRRVVPRWGTGPGCMGPGNSRRDAITSRGRVSSPSRSGQQWPLICPRLRGDGDVRTIQVLLRLPRPVFRRFLGWEWFVESVRRGPLLHPPARALRGDDPVTQQGVTAWTVVSTATGDGGRSRSCGDRRAAVCLSARCGIAAV